MSSRTTRRGLLGLLARRVAPPASDAEPAAQPEPELGSGEAPPAEPAARELSPWERRAEAVAAGRPDSVARVLGFACIGGSPSFCSACVEHCPVPGALEPTGRAPRVNADVCTGCGVCEQVCPSPEKAIHVLPRLVVGGGPSR